MNYKEISHHISEQYIVRNLWALIDQNVQLNSLSKSTMQEILKPFKINPNTLSSEQEIEKKIKQKIMDILYEEKEQFMQYLKLPKFLSIDSSNYNTLKSILIDIWNEFQKKIGQNGAGKYSNYYCQSNDKKQIENFHLGLLQCFRVNFFFKSPRNFGKQNFPDLNYLSNIPNQQMLQIFPNVGNFIGQHFLNKDYTIPTAKSSNQHQPLTNIVKFPQQPAIKVEQNYHFPIQNYKPSLSSTPKELKPNLSSTPKELKPKKKFLPSQTAIIRNKQFIYCPCKGKNNDKTNMLICPSCNKKYHLRCMKIPRQIIQKIDREKVCQNCLIKDKIFYYEILSEPLQIFWVNSPKDYQSFKVDLDPKDAQEMIKKKQQILVTPFKFFPLQHYINFQSSSSLKKQFKSSELVLRIQNFYDQKNQKAQIILQNPSYNSNRVYKSDSDSQSSYGVFILSIVRRKTQKQLMDMMYDYCEQDYLDRFFDHTMGESIRLEIYDQDGLIKTSIRGDQCKHPDPLSIQQYIKHLQLTQNKPIKNFCPACGAQFRTLKVDRKIQNQLDKIMETFDNQSDYPLSITYHKDGTFTWQKRQIKEKSNENLDNNDNSKNKQENENGIQQEDCYSQMSF